jgi:hypothetical protein
MKKLLVAVCLFVSAFGIAQDSKMSKEDEKKLEEGLKMLFDSKIEMTIDRAVFPANEGNTYFTEAQDAGIIAMVAPKSFAKMKEDMDKKGADAIEKGEMIIDGQKILFIKQIKEKEGKEFLVMVYCKANDAESSIMLTSFCEKDKGSVYKPHGEKAIASAKLVK